MCERFTESICICHETNPDPRYWWASKWKYLLANGLQIKKTVVEGWVWKEASLSFRYFFFFSLSFPLFMSVFLSVCLSLSLTLEWISNLIWHMHPNGLRLSAFTEVYKLFVGLTCFVTQSMILIQHFDSYIWLECLYLYFKNSYIENKTQHQNWQTNTYENTWHIHILVS